MAAICVLKKLEDGESQMWKMIKVRWRNITGVKHHRLFQIYNIIIKIQLLDLIIQNYKKLHKFRSSYLAVATSTDCGSETRKNLRKREEPN